MKDRRGTYPHHTAPPGQMRAVFELAWLAGRKSFICIVLQYRPIVGLWTGSALRLILPTNGHLNYKTLFRFIAW